MHSLARYHGIQDKIISLKKFGGFYMNVLIRYYLLPLLVPAFIELGLMCREEYWSDQLVILHFGIILLPFKVHQFLYWFEILQVREAQAMLQMTITL